MGLPNYYDKHDYVEDMKKTYRTCSTCQTKFEGDIDREKCKSCYIEYLENRITELEKKLK